MAGGTHHDSEQRPGGPCRSGRRGADGERTRHVGRAPGPDPGLLAGRKNNYAADRAAADHVAEAMPVVVHVARADRAFLASVVRHLAGDLGIRQFLDIGTGLPAASNTHEVAQQAAPESRIVYVDNDHSLTVVPKVS
jgi:hypothetical protein